MSSVQILVGDCRETLRTLDPKSVQCCVTSPPYWGLRDYGLPPSVWGGDPECVHDWEDRIKKGGGAYKSGSKKRWQHSAKDFTRDDRFMDGHPEIPAGSTCRCGAWRGCLGLEPTPELFVRHMVEVFAEVWRVLRDDGTMWLNLGDCYATVGGSVGRAPGGGDQGERFIRQGMIATQPNRMPLPGLKPKDLVGIPWRMAFALQREGWYLRSDIIWSKPNPMPESVQDRPTKAHEYIFLLTKSERYFYDAAAIKEPVTGGANPRRGQKTPDGWDTSKGDGGHGSFHKNGREQGHTDYIPTPRSYKGSVPGRKDGPGQDRRSDNSRVPGVTPKSASAGSGIKANVSFHEAVCDLVENRNKRTVWTIPTAPYSEAHFATFPPDLIRPCILAGSRTGDTVLDPFGGSGTTGMVAIQEGRKAILCELNPEYAKLIEQRTHTTPGLGL